MNILVCVKQVPDTTEIKIDPVKNTLIRDGVPSIVNPFDGYALEAEADGDLLKVKKEVEEGVEVIGVKFPCLVTYTKPAWDPRYPTIKRKMAANKAEIPVLGDDAFPDIDTTRIGLKGSPTNVKKTFVPQKKSGGVKIQEEDNAASAKKLFELLSAASII